jgi:hypothetical protein
MEGEDDGDDVGNGYEGRCEMPVAARGGRWQPAPITRAEPYYIVLLMSYLKLGIIT